MCIEMCMDMCIEMCIDMCVDTCIGDHAYSVMLARPKAPRIRWPVVRYIVMAFTVLLDPKRWSYGI